MNPTPVSNAILHYTIIKFIIDHGFAPDIAELATLLRASAGEVTAALENLHEDHGVVLHPNSHKIWVIHPFSAAPTNFVVRAEDRMWWGNCAWCSLGVAALLKRNVTITTVLGADNQQVDIHIRDGQVVEADYVVHFPIPMRHAWDNVIYTCSTMLLFESESQVEAWSARHRIPKGDVQPLQNVWAFAQVWYGNHLNPDWKKWTNKEAQAIFERFGLVSDIWHIPVSDARF